jgi:hypothetical protein
VSPPAVVDVDPDLEVSLAEDEEVAAEDPTLAATLGVDELTAEARVPLVEDEVAGEACDLDVPLVEDFDGFEVAAGSAGEVEESALGKEEEDIEDSDSLSRGRFLVGFPRGADFGVTLRSPIK